MVKGVKIVVEVEQSEDRTCIHDRRSVRHRFGGPVFGERAEEQKGGRRPYEKQAVDEKRHLRDDRQPDHHWRCGCDVTDPGRHHVLITAGDRLCIAPKELRHDNRWSKNKAADKGVQDQRQRPAPKRHMHPILGGDIERFRIFQRVGQMLIPVVLQMGFPVTLKREPETERRTGEKPV